MEILLIYKDKEIIEGEINITPLPETIYIYDKKNGERDWFFLVGKTEKNQPIYNWFLSEPFDGNFEKGSSVDRFKINYQTKVDKSRLN